MQEWSHNTQGIVAYLRKISAVCVSECAGTHTRIIIRIILAVLFCCIKWSTISYKQKGRIQYYYALDIAS